MKVCKFFSPLLLGVMAFAVGLTSCSESADSIEDKLKDYVSDDATVVATLDLKRALDAADVTVTDEGTLELPKYLSTLANDMGKDERKALNQLLEFKGFDWSNTVYAMKIDVNEKQAEDPKVEGLIVFSVKDDDEFAASIEETDLKLDIEDEEGYKVVSNKDVAVLIKDHVGFLAFNQKGLCKVSKSAEIIETWKSEADDKPLADWKIDYLKKEKISTTLLNCKDFYKLVKTQMSSYELSMLENLNLDKYVDSFVGMQFDIDKTNVSLAVNVFDKEGKDIKVDHLKNFDTDLLRYANSYDIAAAGLGIGDLNAAVNSIIKNVNPNAEETGYIRQFANLFCNSSVFFACGPVDGLNSFNRPTFGNWHLVGAIKFENADKASQAVSLIGNAMGLANDSSGNLTVNVPVDYEYDYYSGEYRTITAPLYIKRDGQVVVLSNSATIGQGSSNIDKSVFKNKNFAFVAAMDKNNPLFTQFNIPFGVKALLASTASSAEATLSLTGTSGKFVEVLVKFFTEGNFGRGSSKYAEPEFADSVVVEEVAVAEPEPDYYGYETPVAEAPAAEIAY